MAKNDWDNRKLLAAAVVDTFTTEELKSAAATSLMTNYAEYDDIFFGAWEQHRMDEKLAEAEPETKEVRVLVVGDRPMSGLAAAVAEINRENPGTLRILGEEASK